MAKKSKSRQRRANSDAPNLQEKASNDIQDTDKSKQTEKEDYADNSFLPDKIPGAEDSISNHSTPKSNKITHGTGEADNRNAQEDTSYSFPMVHMKKPGGFNTVEGSNQTNLNPQNRQLKKSKIVKISPSSQQIAHNVTQHKFVQI